MNYEPKFIVDLEEAYDPYRWQREENEAKRQEPKLELPPMQSYSDNPFLRNLS